jgi:hypothetical protein
MTNEALNSQPQNCLRIFSAGYVERMSPSEASSAMERV